MPPTPEQTEDDMRTLKALPGRRNACLNCPPILQRLKMNRRIAVGFGIAEVMRGKTVIWTELGGTKYSKLPTLMRFENMARKQHGDWRVRLDDALHGETYQRQGKNLWLLVKTNQGFA